MLYDYTKSGSIIRTFIEMSYMRRELNTLMKLLWVMMLILLSGIVLFVALTKNRIWVKEIKLMIPEETAEHLDNPDRGTYYIYDFLISDEEKDYDAIVKDWFGQHPETRLALMELNLSNYADGNISDQGLNNIERILSVASQTNKHMILRFLYDRNGKAILSEPKNISIICEHMEQLEPLLETYKHSIFALQGLFIGDWGEMHGSRYNSNEEMKLLAKKLESVTPKDIYLSVRTPAQWRVVTGYEGNLNEVLNDPFASHFGLFNDGMLGNEYDTGTYGSYSKVKSGYFHPWVRSEEIAFQNELCRFVPNGGEVIIPNSYNDFENAVADMKQIHVTYLNPDYDKCVWDKWESTAVKEEGVFHNIDGKTYMEEHLGYRFVLRNATASIKRYSGVASLEVKIENIGFAPYYGLLHVNLLLRGSENPISIPLSVEEDHNFLICRVKLNVNEYPAEDYSLSISMTDEKGNIITMSNAPVNEEVKIGEIFAQ